ncbi:protein involved in biosynthesis of mitomycin antibiotics/polyketide fumonisin [Dictyobacter alpinus]|uniref:Protein involved in biosynthesis of mitomycin antibiotics/polyketide fumonisin n=1 Tax=Dictyobacter alpinus TaxID=2014873 RepID=A0A402B2W9_9CHLR|nr:phytanoyl-CoA dioxygenase family protein [Dictyobacter alpinus]GCE25705.1 protein involved in biosynthesis of mitomycin antibiotics/polyketide fumonisin [Dictyobacter alpinus]
MLNAEQQAFYQENGYILVKGVLTKEEAQAYRQECHSLAERLSKEKDIDATWGSARTGVAAPTKILHCHDVQFQAAAFSRLLVDERITGIASDIIGSPNVQLHHNKMFIKPPEKGSPFPLHQDHPFFPHQHHSMIAAIVHFDDAPMEKGCVCVVPGSHKLGPLQHLPEGSWHLPLEQYPLESAQPCPAEAGDVLFFSYLTIHGSGVNVSNEARTTVLIQMRDPQDPPTVDTHKSRGQGMMLRGIDPLISK